MSATREQVRDQVKDPIGWTEVLGHLADNPPIPRSSGESIFVVRCETCDEWSDPQVEEEGCETVSASVDCPRCGAPRHLDKWKVSGLEQGIKAQFEQWVRDGALKAIEETFASGRIEEAEMMRATYLGSRHEYTWDGKHVRGMRISWPGFCQLAYLLLRRCHPKITEATATRVVQANPRGWGMAYGWALGNSSSPAKGERNGETEKPAAH